MRLGAFAVMFAAFLWALDGIVLTPSLYHLDVSLVVFMLHFTPFVFMAIPLFIEREELKKLKARDWSAFTLVGLFGGVIGTMAITKALFYVNFINLSVVVFLQKLQPIFAILLAILILKEKPSKNFFGWATLALVGSYFTTFGFRKPVFEGEVFFASVFALIAAAAWGSSTVFSKFAVTKVNFRVATYLRFGITMVLSAAVVTFLGSWNLGSIGAREALTFIIIAFTTGGAAIFIYYWGLKRITASVSTMAELIFPLSAVILEYLIRGNILSAGQWFGAVILFASVIAISKDS